MSLAAVHVSQCERSNLVSSCPFCREYWPAVRGAWAVSLVFSPLQYVTFRFMPLELRVLSVNICDLAWTSVLSYFSHKREKTLATQPNPNPNAASAVTVAPKR